jgi:hypothetical protein
MVFIGDCGSGCGTSSGGGGLDVDFFGLSIGNEVGEVEEERDVRKEILSFISREGIENRTEIREGGTGYFKTRVRRDVISKGCEVRDIRAGYLDRLEVI